MLIMYVYADPLDDCLREKCSQEHLDCDSFCKEGYEIFYLGSDSDLLNFIRTTVLFDPKKDIDKCLSKSEID